MTANRLTASRAMMVLILAAYVAGRVLAAVPVVERPRELADTDSYRRIANEPILSTNFLAGTRPFIFPLLIKIAGQRAWVTAYVQLAASIIAWALLAWLVARRLQNAWLASAAFALLLAFSLDRHISGWDTVMMSESLSLSFLALFVAAGLGLFERWSARRAILLVAAATPLAFVRDTNAWVLLLTAFLLIVAASFRWGDRRMVLLAIALAAVFALNHASATVGARRVFPLANVIARRILPDAGAVSFFKRCGMPLSPTLMQLRGGFANSEDRLLFEDPGLEPFRRWLRHEGTSCYVRWLVSHPFDRAREVLLQFDSLIAFSKVDGYFSRIHDPLMPVALGRLLYPERFTMAVWLTCTLVAVVAAFRHWWRAQPLWAVFVILALTVFPHIFLAWHGDAMAPERHALSVGVQLYLGFWIMCLLLIERVLLRRGAMLPGPGRGVLSAQAPLHFSACYDRVGG